MARTIHNLRDAWNDAVQHTRARSPGTFDRWFSGIQFDDLTDGVLTLCAKDAFVRDWVSDHYLPSLVEQLRGATGLSIQIAWTLGPVTRPVAAVTLDEAPTSTRIRASRPAPPPGEPASIGPRLKRAC